MFGLTNQEKFVKNLAAEQMPLSFTKSITVAGYTIPNSGMPLVFLQNDKFVYGPGGVKRIAILCSANSSEFIEAFGYYFFIVGSEFTKLGGTEQVASLLNEFLKDSSLNRYARSAVANMRLDPSIVMNAEMRAGLTSVDDYFSNEGADYCQLGRNDDISANKPMLVYQEAVLAAIFNAKIAKKVVKRDATRELSAAHINAKEVYKSIGVNFAIDKSMAKSAKGLNKGVIKQAKARDKLAKKAKKAVHKATLQQVKAWAATPNAGHVGDADIGPFQQPAGNVNVDNAPPTVDPLAAAAATIVPPPETTAGPTVRVVPKDQNAAPPQQPTPPASEPVVIIPETGSPAPAPAG